MQCDHASSRTRLACMVPPAPPSVLPIGFAVIGVIGPDDRAHRASLRQWTSRVAPYVHVRFAVSIRDRGTQAWWESSGKSVEADVDLLDCLGQQSGAGVVIMHLFDAWLRHAVSRYPTAAFIGRADSDAIPSPRWLIAMLAAESARQKALPLADPPPFVYAGSFQWYNWDEKAFRPWGWGNGPWNARRQAVRENPLHCRIDRSTSRCAGPFPFAAGPLILLSMPLAKWYTNSAEAASALSNALDSRLNLTRDATEEHSQQPLSVADARQRGRFLRLSEAGDLEVRIFDDIFLGHALSVGGAAVPNMTVLSFPHGVFYDFPCGSLTSRIDGCRNGMTRAFNWSAPGTPLLAHRVRNPRFVSLALAHVGASSFVTPHAASCEPLRVGQLRAAMYATPWARGWQWCTIPFGKPQLPFAAHNAQRELERRRAVARGGGGSRARPRRARGSHSGENHMTGSVRTTLMN